MRRSQVLSPLLTEWMMGLPEGWITGVPGLTRNQQIKLAGNGVVPQQAAVGFQHLLARLNDSGVQSST
jgi:DNA (cytosine-5)-methyltransferase 1